MAWPHKKSHHNGQTLHVPRIHPTRPSCNPFRHGKTENPTLLYFGPGGEVTTAAIPKLGVGGVRGPILAYISPPPPPNGGELMVGGAEWVETWKTMCCYYHPLYSTAPVPQQERRRRLHARLFGQQAYGNSVWLRPHFHCAPAEQESFVPLACGSTRGCLWGGDESGEVYRGYAIYSTTVPINAITSIIFLLVA
jgi:hypothetical protein